MDYSGYRLSDPLLHLGRAWVKRPFNGWSQPLLASDFGGGNNAIGNHVKMDYEAVRRHPPNCFRLLATQIPVPALNRQVEG
jgi:hypothetical protein